MSIIEHKASTIATILVERCLKLSSSMTSGRYRESRALAVTALAYALAKIIVRVCRPADLDALTEDACTYLRAMVKQLSDQKEDLH